MSEEINRTEGVTRREALKKGARLGGALVWAVPVVQTVGMSAAMAQEASPRCCLEIVSLVASEVGDGNDIRVVWTARNCGTLPVTDVEGRLERSNDGGMTWVFAADTVIGNLGVGDVGDDPTTQNNLPAGDYIYRVKGKFTCDGRVFGQHTIPAAEWVESNGVTAS